MLLITLHHDIYYRFHFMFNFYHDFKTIT